MSDLGALSAAERGFVLGAALSGGGAERLAGDEAGRCAAALDALRALPREVRAGRLARLAAEALAPVPTGIERVARDTLIAALSPHAPELVAALVAGLPAPVVEAGRAAMAGRLSDVVNEDPRRADVAPLAMDPEALADLRRAVFGPLAGS